MDPNTTILRVKRKRGTDPADSLLLACKRIRPESSQNAGETVPEPNEAEVENSVFKLVATVATQDAPVQTQVRHALARPRAAHALRPSAASSQRIIGDLRSTKKRSHQAGSRTSCLSGPTLTRENWCVWMDGRTDE
uniref:Solute carrier family 7 member 6 opposite strand n=1 Tax=Cyprinodon variegatus TaxID=28743 RepID=A0A3Q2CBT7_CYPVA